jgi:hypothetical protein
MQCELPSENASAARIPRSTAYFRLPVKKDNAVSFTNYTLKWQFELQGMLYYLNCRENSL